MELYTEEELRDLLDEAYAMGQQDLVDYIDEAYEEEEYDNAYNEDYEDDSLFDRVMQETKRWRKDERDKVYSKIFNPDKYKLTNGINFKNVKKEFGKKANPDTFGGYNEYIVYNSPSSTAEAIRLPKKTEHGTGHYHMHQMSYADDPRSLENIKKNNIKKMIEKKKAEAEETPSNKDLGKFHW